MTRDKISKRLMRSFPICTLIWVLWLNLNLEWEINWVFGLWIIFSAVAFGVWLFLYVTRSIAEEWRNIVTEADRIMPEIPKTWTEDHENFQKSYISAYKAGKWANIFIIWSIILEVLAFILFVYIYISWKNWQLPTFDEALDLNFIDRISQFNQLFTILYVILFIIFAVFVYIYIYRSKKSLNYLWYNFKSSIRFNILINILLILRSIIVIPMNNAKYIFRVNQYLLNNKTIPFDQINTDKVTGSYTQYILILIAIIQIIISDKLIGILWDRSDKVWYIKYLSIAHYEIISLFISIIASILIYRSFYILYSDHKKVIENNINL